jgi:UDP-3-O-[3-hydroxymyristoyl] glucosamine N-acyltransferase
MERTLQALTVYLKGRLIGDGATLIRDVNDVAAVQAGQLTFAEDPAHLAQALASPAAGVIVSSDVTDLVGKSGISVPNPKLAFALMMEVFRPDVPATPGIHPSAVLGKRVRIGEQAMIGAHVVVGHDVQIGTGTVIEAGTYLGDGVTIGDHCFIAPNVVIYRQSHLGHRVRIHASSVVGADGFGYVFHEGRYVKIPQVGNVELGANVCIDRATLGSTIIKRGTKIDNLVQIAHNNVIGEHVVMAGQVGLAGSVTVGNYAAFGGQAGVIDHLTIGDAVQVGAGTLVTKSFPAKTKLWGLPARDLHDTKREMASLKRLPLLLKQITQMLARLTALETRSRTTNPKS